MLQHQMFLLLSSNLDILLRNYNTFVTVILLLSPSTPCRGLRGAGLEVVIVTECEIYNKYVLTIQNG